MRLIADLHATLVTTCTVSKFIDCDTKEPVLMHSSVAHEGAWRSVTRRNAL